MKTKRPMRICLCVAMLFFLFDAFAVAAILAPPAPDIKANGQNGSITVTAGTPVSITASLAPGDEYGRRADWWLAYSSPAGWYSFTSSGWIPGINLLFQYPLFSVPSVVIYYASLSVGDYAFYFLVDMNPNGVVDSPYYYKVVQVHVIASTPTTNISGSWAGTALSNDGGNFGIFPTLSQSGSAVTGSLNITNTDCGGDLYNIPISGAITGDTLNVTGIFLCGGSYIEIKFTQGVISGNTINGYYSLYFTNGEYFDSGAFHIEKQ
jgi:hypothetical protein